MSHCFQWSVGEYHFLDIATQTIQETKQTQSEKTSTTTNHAFYWQHHIDRADL